MNTAELYAQLVNHAGLVLAHDTLADARDCDSCTIAQDENAHTMRDYLPAGLSGLQPELDRIATCYPAEILADELVCWCGHSLHLPDCPDAACCHMEESEYRGWCRNTWTARAWQPIRTQAAGRHIVTPPAVWSCPGEGPHRPKLAVEEDGRHVMVWCRDCMTISRVDCATGQTEDVTDG